MHLDHEVDVRADRFAYGGHDGDRASPVCRADPHACRAERVDLHRPVAACHNGHRELGDPGGLEVGLVPAVRIGRHAIAEPATEELPDRDAELLADEIEGGDVERGERGLAMLTRPAVLETLDRPRQPFGVERVRPDDVPRAELFDDRDERVGLVDRPNLADAGQADVGLELDEHELAPGCPDDRRPDVGDLHVASSRTGRVASVAGCRRGTLRRSARDRRVRIPSGRGLEWPQRARPGHRTTPSPDGRGRMTVATPTAWIH